MKNQGSPYKNIYAVLRLNRLISIAVSVGAFSVCFLAVLLIYNMHRQTLEHSFAITEAGQVIPLVWQKRRENLEVEARAHLERFHRLFYELSPGTYRTNLEKALWLGNSSVDEVYRQKKADGVYNRILQYALVQQVDSLFSHVVLEQPPYPFQTRLIFRINRGSVEDTYELITSGKLLPVERSFPQNPHGLLITEYFENRLRKIDEKP